MKKQLANMVTGIRVLGSVCILCVPVFSPLFYSIYLLCGFTDMIDGTIARKTNAVTSFGSQLDSVADLMFLAAASIRILPVIYMPAWLWCSALVVFGMKIAAVIWKCILGQPGMFPHTLLNKIAGLLLFLLPLSLPFAEIKYGGGIVCVAAFLSAAQELKAVVLDDGHR